MRVVDVTPAKAKSDSKREDVPTDECNGMYQNEERSEILMSNR